MLVQMHTNFCLLCVLSFLFQQCHRCHEHSHRPHNHSDLQLPQRPQEAGILEEEQQFYIQQLFRRYGQKDRLDFDGFQSLLFSLGLGEVKLVEMDHEELGHDHVAHLDVIDLQEGLHSHSASGDSHAHGHGHHKHESHGANTEQAPTKCTRQTTAAGAARGTTKDQESGLNRGRKVDQDGHRHFHEEHQDVTSQHEQDLHKEHKSHDSHSHHEHDHDGHDHGTDSGQNGGGIKAEEDKKHDGTQDKESKDKEDVVTSHSQHEHDHGGHDGHIREEDTRQKGGRLEVESVHEEHKTHDSHSHHEHDHEGHDSGQNGGQIETGHERKHPHGQDKDSQWHHEHEQTSTVSAPLFHVDQIKPSQPSPVPTESRPKKHKKTAKGKGQRGRSGSHTEEEHSHDHEHSGAHKSKREAPGGNPTPTAPGLLAPGHPSGASHQHEECLNLTQLLTYYGLSADSLISPVQFTYLCPALLYQIDSRVCIRHYHQVEVEQEALQPANPVWVWLWGFVSITIISLLSLLGVVLVPILDQGCFKFMLTFLVALAVGTLSGDALLHLLPHSQGQHDHSQDSSGHDSHTNFDGIWKGLTALAGIYLLFIIEHCLGMFKHYKDQKALAKGEEGAIGRKLSDHKLNRRSDAEWLHLKPLNEDPDSVTVCDNGHSDTQITELQTPESSLNQTLSEPPSPKKNGHRSKPHRHGHGHSHGGNCHSDQDMKDAGIASIAWMVIMGDGMHNFSDGLAIGAAFSANLTGGISTSVAVFCHELPHELGDFAVLIKAGMSVKQAIVYNVLSALMAYVGMLIGTAVGQYTHHLTSWIFAVTAGMFLYVALVDMLPEMLHGDSEEHKRCHLGHFLLQNVGLLTGFTIMLLIAIFEDRIVFNFEF